MSELKFAGNDTMSGFGTHSAAEVEQLQKALGLGGQGGTIPTDAGGTNSYVNQFPSDFRDGNALAVEDLDRTLKLVTFGLEHLRLWKDILKERVPQVVHEYNVQNAYGESDASPFFQMGATPVETDAQYARDVVQIKYLGTKGAVLHNLTLIQAAHGPVVAREVKNKTIELLARNERAMFDAKSRVQGEEYDGLESQIVSKGQNPSSTVESIYASKAFESYGNTNASHLLDANGADFDEDIAEDAALTAVNNFGMPMDMYLGTDVHSAFSRAFYAKQRTVPGESLTSGNRVTEHMGTLDYRFKPSLFNRPRLTPKVGVTEGASTLNGVALSLNTGSGNIRFLLVPVTAIGESSGAAAHIPLGANNDDLQWITSGSLPSGLIYFNLYSADVSGTAVIDVNSYRFVRRVSTAEITGTLGSANSGFDIFGIPTNAQVNSGSVNLSRIAGTAKAFLLMHDPDVLCWKQLGSMIKYDLAVTTTQYEWLQLLYGTPLVMAPYKNVIVRNLKSD